VSNDRLQQRLLIGKVSVQRANTDLGTFCHCVP
jgi:hypothetical protein